MLQVGRTVLALALLMIVARAVPLVDGVRQGRAVAWSAFRGAAQLLTVYPPAATGLLTKTG